jgi:hypothetical protein
MKTVYGQEVDKTNEAEEEWLRKYLSTQGTASAV